MRLGAILRRRCPKCLKGAVFAGVFRMHARCPACGFGYFPEPGYFMGAIYFSYGMALFVGTPVFLGLLYAGVDYWHCVAATGGFLTLLFPALRQYSRVLWLHFDRTLGNG